MRCTPPTFTLALLMMAPLAQANHIDFIQDDSVPGNGVTNATFSLSSSNATPASNTQVGDPADILGGTRAVTVVRDEGFGGSITASKVAGTDFISVMNGNTAAGNVTLDYNGFDNLNFAAQWSRIDVGVTINVNASNGIGDPEFDLFLTVESSAGSGTVQSARIEGSVAQGATTISFPFSHPGFSAVDFTDVDRVTLLFDTKVINTDYQIDFVTRNGAPVPEPAGAALVGLAAVGLLRRPRG